MSLRGSYVIILVILVSLFFTTNSAFAEITIVPVAGSSIPGCEDLDGCFLPSIVTVDVGESVIFSNTDIKAHTWTANNGEFNTSLIMAGDSYVYTPNTAGTIPYLCAIHPWMQGTIIVQGAPEPTQNSCDAAYPDVCIPVYPPDLDCDEIPYTNFRVLSPDPHGFDGDNDGIGCELSSSTIITLDSSKSSITTDEALISYSGQLVDENGFPVSGKTILVQANSDTGRGQGKSAVTDSNGYFVAELNFWSEYEIANWTIYAEFEGDSEYKKSSSNTRQLEVTLPVPEPEPEPVYANVSFTNPRSVDAFGNVLTNIEVFQQIQIATDATNHSNFSQDFAYYISIRGTEVEAWITGSLSSGQSFSPALSWIPTEAGTFTVDISLFDNIENKHKLSESVSLQIIVADSEPELTCGAGTELVNGICQAIPPSISAWSEKSSYENGDVIKISGKVTNPQSNLAVSIVLTRPDGDLLSIDQVSLSYDNTFSTTITAGGPLMDVSGTYMFNVGYGSASDSGSFYYSTPTIAPIPSSSSGNIEVSGYSVGYVISGGNLQSIVSDLVANSLIISIDATDDGSLTLTIPRSVLDALLGNGDDDDFVVLINGGEVYYDEIISSTDRTLTLVFPAGAEVIEIIGTSTSTPEPEPEPVCGLGTVLKDGVCVVIDTQSTVSWDKDSYKFVETGVFTLVSNNANENSNLIDFAYVHLSSDSDKIGSTNLAVETGVNTGVFVGDVQFGTDTDSGGSLKTKAGDLVYVEFDSLSDSAEILPFYPEPTPPPPAPAGTDVVIQLGSSVPGCETTNSCWIPSTITVDVGDSVTWYNADTAIHTVTGGSLVDGPSGVFDSSMISAGQSYAYKFESSGTFDYFCMLHPWMQGSIIVSDGTKPDSGETLYPDLYFTPPPNRIEIGTPLKFSGQLTADELHVTGKTIYIKDDIDFGTDRLIISATTDQNGEFSVTWDAVLRTSGSYDLYAVFEGDSEAFRARSATYSVYVSTEPVPPPPTGNNVEIPLGSSVPGCETTNSCWIPSTITVDVGDSVTWYNADTSTHTVTSGNVSDETVGTVFNSGMIVSGSTFEVTFTQDGTFPYFCMVHPWQIGTVIVGDGGGPIVNPTISVSTDRSSYTTGDTINVSGSISQITQNLDVALVTTNPEGDILIIHQLPLSSSGTYSTSIITGGPLWELSGTHTIKVQYGKAVSETTFTFTAVPKISASVLVLDPLPTTVNREDFVLITGRLKTESGMPITFRTVNLVSAHDDVVAAITSTDSNGEFAFSWNVKYSYNTYSWYTEFIGDNQFTPSNSKIQSVSIALYPDLYFTPLQNRILIGTPLEFSGQLTAEGLPLAGKTIYIKDDIDFGTDRNIVSATTDQNGEFSVTWDPVLRSSGSYDFYAVFERDSEAFRARSATYSVYVSVTQVFEPVRVYTEKTVFSEGDSLRISGSATPNEELEIALVDSRENIIMQKSVKVDSTGLFSMVFFTWQSSSNLNFGEYGIVAWSPIDMRYDGLWVSFIKLEPETFQTKITLNRPQSFVILNEPITFTGQLLTTDGQPLTFTTVGIATITDQVPEALQTGTTDSSGKFSITWTSRYTSLSTTIPVYAYFGGNQVFDHSTSNSYNITIEKPSLSLFTEKTSYRAGELLIVYGYGNPGDTINVSLRSQQGQIMSNSVKVASDSSYTIFFDLIGISQGSYTVTAISSSFGITDSTTIFVEAEEVLKSTNIVGDVYFSDQGRKVPLDGIKAVLTIGANHRVDYVDSSGKFEFNNIDIDSRVSYLIHFEMTDGKSFNFIDSQLYNTSTTNPSVIKSRTMLLNIDETFTTNNFAINLGLNMPSSYSSTDTYYINKAFDLQSKVVNFYNRVLNEKPPMINVFLFQDGSSYSPVVWNSKTGNVESTYQPKIRLSAQTYDMWSAIGMEYTHYVQDFSYKKMHGFDTRPINGNHLGFNNPSTGDSWVEGVGTFMPALIANWYNLPEAGKFSNNSLEQNKYKPNSNNLKYSGYWLDEEYAIATLLWDLYDRKQDGENISLSVSEIWKLIDGFDDFQKYNSQDYMKKYSYSESIAGNERHIKYFKDFYDYMSDYDVNHDGQINSGDQKIVDEVFTLHGIPNGYTDSEKTRV